MTHEVTVKIDGKPVKFRFGTRTFHNCSVDMGLDLAGLFTEAQRDYLKYWARIVYWAAKDCPENDLARLPEDSFEWFDMMDEKSNAAIQSAHANAKILGKSIRG